MSIDWNALFDDGSHEMATTLASPNPFRVSAVEGEVSHRHTKRTVPLPPKPDARPTFLKAKRGCIATRDLPAGSVLLRAKPAVLCLRDDYCLRNCTFCLREVKAPQGVCLKCKRCAWCPACDTPASRYWHELECGWMQEAEESGITKELPSDYLRFAFRYIVSQYHFQPRMSERDLDKLHHLCKPINLVPESHSKMFSTFGRYAAQVSGRGLPPEAFRRRSRELYMLFVTRMFNAHGIPGGKGWMVVPSAAFFNHSCAPNAKVSVSTTGGWLTVRTMEAVRAGDEICIFYVDPGLPKVQRQAELSRTFCFECACQRCLSDDSDGRVEAAEEDSGDKGEVMGTSRSIRSFFLHNMVDSSSTEQAKEGPKKAIPVEAEGTETKMEAWRDPAPKHVSLSSTLASLGLDVKPSLIPEAGQGLFTVLKRAKGSKICVYEGTRHNTASALALQRKDYLMRLGAEAYVDARLHLNVPARYINDARVSAGVNVIFDKKPKDGVAVVHATRDIQAGEELYADYGGHYWAGHDVLQADAE